MNHQKTLANLRNGFRWPAAAESYCPATLCQTNLLGAKIAPTNIRLILRSTFRNNIHRHFLLTAGNTANIWRGALVINWKHTLKWKWILMKTKHPDWDRLVNTQFSALVTATKISQPDAAIFFLSEVGPPVVFKDCRRWWPLSWILQQVSGSKSQLFTWLSNTTPPLQLPENAEIEGILSNTCIANGKLTYSMQSLITKELAVSSGWWKTSKADHADQCGMKKLTN